MSDKVDYIHLSQIHNCNSSDEILPYLIQIFKPQSILDVGCGTGTWLKSALALGITDIKGIDGAYIDEGKLEIDRSNFQAFDLRNAIDLNRKFSLVLCLEVAEHLEEKYADVIVENLIRHADTIVFSAALPCQGGQNHVNEQPFEYWIAKFYKHNYYPLDIVRQKFWNNPKVDWWYKQNIFVFTRNEEQRAKYGSQEPINTYIHPELFISYVKEFEKLKQSVSSPLKYLKYLLLKGFRK